MNSNNNKPATALLDRIINHNQSPGLQYVVYENGKLVFEHNIGMAEFETERKISPETIFNVCSFTKTFTATAVMQLAETGKLKLSDSASMYIERYPFKKEITINQLLSHTSGIVNPVPLRWAHLHEEDADFNRDDFFYKVLTANSKLKSEPGEKFAYSNLNFLMLGKVIEKASGQNYRDYVLQHIIAKLDTDRTPINFTVTDYTNYARGYQKRFTFINAILGFFLDRKKFMEPGSNKKWTRFKNYYVSGSSYGGLIANAYSLIEFIQRLLKPNSLLLSDEWKKIMLSRQRTSDGKEIGMTLGWFAGKLNNMNYFGHPGAGGGFYCELRAYPEKDIITAVMFNRSGMGDERFLDKIDPFFL